MLTIYWFIISIDMKRNNIIYILLSGFLILSLPSGAQDAAVGEVVTKNGEKRAWEIGIGASIFQFSRVDFTRFQPMDENYQLGLQLRHSVIGPNLYLPAS